MAVVHSMNRLPPLLDFAVQLVNSVSSSVRDAFDELITETYIAPDRPFGEAQFVKEVVRLVEDDVEAGLFLLMARNVLEWM